MKKQFLCLLLLFSYFCLFSNTSKIQNRLIKSYPNLFFKPDVFYYIGDIQIKNKKYEFYQNEHEFANHRMTSRLVVVLDNKVKGFYTQIQDKPVILNNCLVFDYEEKLGNKIDFSTGIPDRVYLNGEHYRFQKLR